MIPSDSGRAVASGRLREVRTEMRAMAGARGTRGSGTVRPGDRAAFAHRLRTLMEDRGWSVHETARRVKEHLPEGESISQASISRYRTGRAVPRLGHLQALSLALGVPKSELMSASEEDEGAGLPAQDTPAQMRRRRWAAADRGHAADERQVGQLEGFVQFVDLGDKMHLVVDQVVPWSTGLKILKILRGSTPEAEPQD